MSAVIACVVCARPLDSLLTSGLHDGVLVMAVVAVAVTGAIARGALRLLREDAAQIRHEARAGVNPPGGRP
jgi:hypothetical protein